MILLRLELNAKAGLPASLASKLAGKISVNTTYVGEYFRKVQSPAARRTELNASPSNSEGIVPRPAGAATDSIHNEHRRLFGGSGRYNPFSRGGPRPQKAPKAKRQHTWTRKFVCLPNKSDAFPPTFTEYARLKKAGLGDRKITLNLDYGPLEVDQKLKEAFPKPEDSGGYSLLRTPERGC